VEDKNYEVFVFNRIKDDSQQSL